jgi:hypothetical protein
MAESGRRSLLPARQMYDREWKDALGTTVRVSQVSGDIVGKEVSSALLAVCGFQSRYLKQSSAGFIPLENANSLSKRKKEKIGRIAVRIFGKNPPNDPFGLPSFPCKKCKKPITAPKAKCSCGYVTVANILSGKQIARGGSWRCPKCKHFAMQEEIASLSVCPLCHTPIQGKS